MKIQFSTIAAHALEKRQLTIPGQVASFYAYKSARTSESDTTNTISWTSPTDTGNGTISSYKLEYSSNDSTWSTLYEGSNLSYSHTGVHEYNPCYYRISASNQLGYGSTTKRTQNFQKFWNSNTFTVPATTNKIAALVVGGGSSNSGYSANAGFAGAGGGGGGVALSYSISLNPLSSLSITVGAAGSTGGTSKIVQSSSTLLQATGGVAQATLYGGSSGTGTVNSGSAIYASTSKSGGINVEEVGWYGDWAVAFGGGAGVSTAGSSGTASWAMGSVGGNGGDGVKFFKHFCGYGGGGLSPDLFGQTIQTTYDDDGYWLVVGRGFAQNPGDSFTYGGLVLLHYFS